MQVPGAQGPRLGPASLPLSPWPHCSGEVGKGLMTTLVGPFKLEAPFPLRSCFCPSPQVPVQSPHLLCPHWGVVQGTAGSLPLPI